MICLAKTLHNRQCHRLSRPKSLFCTQHHKAYVKYLQQKDYQSNQTGGSWLTPLINIPVPLPSCLDILSCDWITDIAGAVPGLSSILSTLS